MLPPQAQITDSIRRGMDATRRRHRAGYIDHQAVSKRSQSLSTVASVCRALTLRFSTAHRCSMGFKSGLCESQATVATWFSPSHAHFVWLVCLGSLSCCSTYTLLLHGRSHAVEGSKCHTRTSMYTEQFIVVKMRHAFFPDTLGRQASPHH